MCISLDDPNEHSYTDEDRLAAQRGQLTNPLPAPALQHEPTCAYYPLAFKPGSANRICSCPGRSAAAAVVDADALIAAERETRQAHDAAEETLQAALDEALLPKPPCGSGGGWSFDRFEDDQAYFEHDCFYQHRYDLHTTYHASLPIREMIEGA